MNYVPLHPAENVPFPSSYVSHCKRETYRYHSSASAEAKNESHIVHVRCDKSVKTDNAPTATAVTPPYF